MKNEKIKEFLDKLKNNEINAFSFVDTQLLEDAFNGYRNDDGITLWTQYKFDGNIATIYRDYEFMQGNIQTRESILTRAQAVRYLLKDLKRTNDIFYLFDAYK